MTKEDAASIAELVIHRARVKRRPYAVFVHQEGVVVVGAHGEHFARAMRRFEPYLVGVYDCNVPHATIIDDLVGEPSHGHH